jgi:transcriptional antiterminator
MDDLSSPLNRHSFNIKERRKQVAALVSRSLTEQEMAKQIGVGQATISRDIKVLKGEAQQFVYDLAKSDLAYYYKQSIDGIEEAKKESWKIYNDQTVPMREKLLALKIIIQADETRFKLLLQGPAVLAMKHLQERVSQIENR